MDEGLISGGEFYLGPANWDQINKGIDDKVDRMAPGEVYIYHHGFLAVDREHSPEVDHVADRFLLHGTPPNFAFGIGCHVKGTGRGRLTQIRLRDGSYLYLFVKNRRQQRSFDYR